jgi:ADP-ribosylglycohydrolase
MHPLYEIVLGNLRTDIRQMTEEGHEEEALLAEVEQARATGSVDSLLALQEALWNRPSPPAFPYEEPNDWPSIAAGFPDPESHLRFPGSDRDLADRLHAAWLGRCAGCQLGKPLEGVQWPEKMRAVLQAAGSWPLTDYMNAVSESAAAPAGPDAELLRKFVDHPLTRGRFDAVSPDDDIHYTLISQSVLEKYGTEFTTEQAIGQIVHYTPGSMIFAAGKSMWRTALFGFKPPHTALFGNPCRQSLGAMIRCDAWGWGAPANPALAARMAYRDAVGSQTRNGTYSGIFFAALLADTLASGDPVRSIEAAAAYVPPQSRFAEMIRFVQSQCAAEKDWEKVNAAIYAKYATEARQFNHSLPNAAIVLMGILLGGGDFTRTLGVTVMAGMDTDCTGATAGSVMGCALGTRGIPAHWTAPLNDTIRTQLAGLPELRISEVAGKMYEIAKPNARRARDMDRR